MPQRFLWKYKGFCLSSDYVVGVPRGRQLQGKVSRVRPVLSGHSKRRPKLAFKTDYRLMQVKSIAECSKRPFCNTFYLH